MAEEKKKVEPKVEQKLPELRSGMTVKIHEKIKDIDVIVKETTGNQKELIVQATEAVKPYEKGLCILISKQENKVLIVGARSPSSNLKISNIIQEMSALLGGSGGGKGDIAVGGGPEIDKLPVVLKEANRIIKSKI